VKPVFVHAVWKLKIPPRIPIFLWLLSKNKMLTRDNLAKRRNVDDKTCIFCADLESIHHLFFDCCVVKRLWIELSECMSLNGEWSYGAVASLWLANKKHMLSNVIFAAALWCLWKLRNMICFRGDVDRYEGDTAVDFQDTEKKATNVYWSNKGGTDGGDTEDGTKSGAASWNLLASVKITNIGNSSFGGLQCCDSAEF
jgi:hypothetical protein